MIGLAAGDARDRFAVAVAPVDHDVGAGLCLNRRELESRVAGFLMGIGDEHVGAVVGVARRQVGGKTGERHVAVGADRREEADAIACNAVGSGRNQRGGAGLQVFDEDVLRAVAVARHQIGGGAHERHIAAVGADRGK